jgi:hypothetical protein
MLQVGIQRLGIAPEAAHENAKDTDNFRHVVGDDLLNTQNWTKYN